MKYHLKYCFLLLIMLLTVPAWAQSFISGRVTDSKSGEVLIGANIYEPTTLQGTSTDNNGYFSLTLPSAKNELMISYVGYTTQIIRLQNNRDTILYITLNRGSELEEVRIKAPRKITFNQSSLTNEQLKLLPAIGAEPDVLKSIQLLPGIQAPNEGSSNLLVRGGSPGQNLFLVDNVSLFYVNHLGGFFSVFNPQVINDVKVIKGGFPAKYGGKLSSVVDITLREGNQKEMEGYAGIGVMGAYISLGGPLSEKMNYLFSCRKTFTELLLAGATYMQGEGYIASYGFYDLNAKLSWHPDENNTLQANLFMGDDKWGITLFDGSDFGGYKNKWGNVLGSLHWKSILNSKTSVNNTLSYTRYRVEDKSHMELRTDGDSLSYFSTYRSLASDLSINSQWRYRISSILALDFGFKSSLLAFQPNNFQSNENPDWQIQEKIQGLESGIYLENQLSPGSHLKINLGLRLVNYLTENYYDFSLEPRLDISYHISNSQVLNATYMLGSQYSHLVFSSGDFLNNEVWIPTMEGMDPARVEQYSLGWKGHFHRDMFSAELNLYTKKMSDLIVYKEGLSNLHGDVQWKSKLEEGGFGQAHGAELFISKDKGRYTGFLSYTYAQSTRQFENINNGIPYTYEYDRPHSFSIDLNRKINDRFAFNLLWVYQSGLPYTPVIARGYIPYTGTGGTNYSYEALLFGERNSARMEAYHRLDLALYLKTKTIKNRDETWTFSIYNAYNRKNPYYYYYSDDPVPGLTSSGDNDILKLFKFSAFPIIPSVSYKVEF